LTKTFCGFRQRSGSSSTDGISSTFPVHRGPAGVDVANLFAQANPREAIRSA
jgi:hypothetical protein